MKKYIQILLLFVFGQTSGQNDVEKMPVFPGGNQAVSKFINDNIKTVRLENQLGIEGKVYVKFAVDTNGNVTDVTLEKGIDYAPGYNQEAIRVISQLPQWQPATKSGKPVKVYFNMPISFRSSMAGSSNYAMTQAQKGDYDELISLLKKEYKDWEPPSSLKNKPDESTYADAKVTYYDYKGIYSKDEKWQLQMKQYFFQPSYANGLLKNRIQIMYRMKSIATGSVASRFGSTHSIGIAEQNDLIYVEANLSTMHGTIKKTANVLKKDIKEISKGHYLLSVSSKDDNFVLTLELIKEGNIFARFEAISIDEGVNEPNSYKVTTVLSGIVPTVMN